MSKRKLPILPLASKKPKYDFIENKIKLPILPLASKQPKYDSIKNEVVIPYFVNLMDETLQKRDLRLAMQKLKQKSNPNPKFESVSQLALKSLSPGKWVNDEVINTYIKGLIDHYNQKNKNSTVKYYNSYFYTKLTDSGKGYKFKNVERWMKKDDPRKCNKLFIPIHVNGNHWNLTVIDWSEKTITVYDSLYSKSVCDRIINILMRWLSDLEENVEQWSGLCGTAIQQQNQHDCGVFTMKHAEYLLEDKAFDFTTKDMSKFRDDIKNKLDSTN